MPVKDMERLKTNCERTSIRGKATFAIAALLGGLIPLVPPAVRGSDEALADKLPENWSQTVVLQSLIPDGGEGECRLWVEDGWLIVERRSAEDEVEWKVVLAKARADEVPEVIANRIPGTVRVSYGDGRYFVRDEFGSFRCLRQAKPDDEPWPNLEIPPADPNAPSGSAGVSPHSAGRVTQSWFIVTTGPKRGSVDCLVRIDHQQLQAGGFGFRGGPVGSPARVHFGEMRLMDDGDLLVAERREAWQAKSELARRAIRAQMVGSPPPELSGDVWFNANEPVSLKSLDGRPALLVFLDLRQPSFRQQLPLLKGFYDFHSKKGLAVVGVHQQYEKSEVEKQIADSKLDFPILLDDGQTAQRYATAFPSYFLINCEGKVASAYQPTLPSPGEMDRFMEANKVDR